AERLARRGADPPGGDAAAASAGASFTAAPGQHRRPGDRAPPPPRRARRIPMVLRKLQPSAVRGIRRAHRHRDAVPADFRPLLRQPAAAHLLTVRNSDGAQDLNALLRVGARDVVVDLSHPVSLARELDFHGAQPQHFGAPAATSQPYRVPGFSGSVASGASCNCEVISVIPHCNGTHTESAGHLTREPLDAARIAPRGLVPALLVSTRPTPPGQTSESSDPAPQPDDRLVTRESLQAGWPAEPPFAPRALVIRTLPNEPAKRTRDYTDITPPYLTREAARFIVAR